MQDELKALSPSDFPPLLREIPDAPKQLYVRGSLPSFELKWLAVVGSRTCTPYGRQALTHLMNGLRGQPIVIVSGLALGIDAEAHRAALDAGLTCVAVPGSGLDWNVLYPRTNVALAREILATGGALVSEFEPKTKAADYTFPQRNRIMAGMCHATLVIEARERSGSLITARFATEYNRELLVVPGSIFSPESAGAHQFLKLGATPATESSDILKTLGLEKRTPLALSVREDLSPEEIHILEQIMSPLSRAELIDSLDMPVSDATTLLSIMEIKGLIVEELGFIRCASIG